MNISNTRFLKKAIQVVLLGIIPFTTFAQKLPNLQLTGLRIPANCKIDGKATEWDNSFQAYNKTTEVYYTIANDDDNLYLTIQAADALTVEKVINGGVTFTINTSGVKNEEDAIAITWPVFEKNQKPTINFKDWPRIIKNSDASVKQADSFMYISNKHLTDKIKLIKITGIKSLDTLISVYNDYGIKVMGQLDNKMAFTYELLIPLKYLTIPFPVVTGDNLVKISYNIRVNAANGDMNGTVVSQRSDGVMVVKYSPGTLYPAKNDRQEFMSPVDFWGEYTLAKL